MRFIIPFIILLSIKISFANKEYIIDHDKYLKTNLYFFDKDSNKIFLDQYEGKTILLVFWSTWCSSCIEEIIQLDNLQKDFKKIPFEVLAISEDFHGIELIEKFFSEYEIRHLNISHDYKNYLFKEMSIVGLPTSFLINHNGKIKKIFKGKTKWCDNNIREIILSCINGNYEMPRNSYDAELINSKILNKNIKNNIEKLPNK